MDRETFKQCITYFKIKEVTAVGSEVEDISLTLMDNLDALRHNLIKYDKKVKIRITSLTGGSHAKRSLHNPENNGSRECEAVDFKVIGKISKNNVVQEMIDAGFTGIGVYHGFYHGDIRQFCKLWKRIKGKYLPLIQGLK